MQKTLQKPNRKHIKSVVAALLALFLLLAGCGGSSQPSNQPSNQTSGQTSGQADTISYRVTEKALPDPKTEFENDPAHQLINLLPSMDATVDASVAAEAKTVLSPMGSCSAEGKLCALYHVMYTVEGHDLPYFTGLCCLCVLDSPYDGEWQYYIISSDCWGSDLSYSFYNFLGVSDGGVYICLTLPDGNNVHIPSCIGFYGWDGSCRLIEAPGPDTDFNTLALYAAGETLYAVSGFPAASFTAYDEQLKPALSQNLENPLYGCVSRDSEYLWYGLDSDQNLTIWDKPNGTRLFSLGNTASLNFYSLLTASPGGEFILADVNGLWIGREDASLTRAFSFAEQGYVLQELLALSANEDGSLSLVVRLEDEGLFLLTMEQTEGAAKQEITLVAYTGELLSNLTAAFNRQNDKYYITLVNPSATADSEDYVRQLQLEMSAGRGPDLMSPFVIDMESCIRNDYLEPLDDLIENTSDYWPACLENGRTDGVLYGMPYRAALSFLVTSEALADGAESWTLDQMVNAVQGSPAEILERNLSSMDIVLQYGLMTPDNPQFIDYDAGVSHLTEQPFLDFLEFAKKYGDQPADSSPEQTAESHQDKEYAVQYLTLNAISELSFISDDFQGRAVLIGIPAAQGRGVRMISDLLCLNRNSQCKEGAMEFLRYLISAEGQSRFVQSYQGFSYDSYFSCRRDVTETVLNDYREHLIKEARAAAEETESTAAETEGTESDGDETEEADLDGLSPEQRLTIETQMEQIRSLFDNARSDWPWPQEIYNIAYEELAPYFAGDCSAEEAVGKLDNRVQLYFDEQR